MTLQTVDLQAPLSKGFPRQEYWSGLPFLSPADLPDPGIEPRSPELQADSLLSELPGEVIVFSFPEESHMTWTFSRREGTSRI